MGERRRRSLWSNTKFFLPLLLAVLVPATGCGGLFTEAAADPSDPPSPPAARVQTSGTVPVQGCTTGTVVCTTPTPVEPATPVPEPDASDRSVQPWEGDFEILAADQWSDGGCAADEEFMGVEGQGSARASELWFTLQQSDIDAHRTTWWAFSCEGLPWRLGEYGVLPEGAGETYVSNHRFRDRLPVREFTQESRVQSYEISGRPTLIVYSDSPRLPGCTIAVVERRPVGNEPGLGWTFSTAYDGLRVGTFESCETLLPSLEQFLEQWAEPWVEPSSTASDALQDYMDNRDDRPTYVGLCHKYRREPSPDGICGFDHGESGDQKVFGISTLDNQGWAIELYFVRPEGDGWVVDHSEPGPCRNSIPCPAPPGATIEIVVDDEGSCANVRSQPAIDAPIEHCLPGGTQGLTNGEGVWVDGRIWVELVDRGWVSASYLRCTGNCTYPEGYFSCGGG